MSFSRSCASRIESGSCPRALNRSTWKTSRSSIFSLVEHVVERRVRDEAAVPVMLAVDLDRRKSWRQCARGHDVLRADLLFRVVEIGEVAGAHVHRADAEAHVLLVDEVEVDQPRQRLAQRRGVVVADRLRRAAWPQRCRRHARREEAGHAEGRDPRSAGFVERRARLVALQDRPPQHRRGDELPEFLQARDAQLLRVAGDDRRIDRADRDAGDPCRIKLMPAKRVIGARLIRPQRAAALQDEDALGVGRALRRLRGRSGVVHRNAYSGGVMRLPSVPLNQSGPG